MANNTAPMPPGVNFSERLWSEEVGIAAAEDPIDSNDPNRQPGYEFSNGVKFFSGKGAYGTNDS